MENVVRLILKKKNLDYFDLCEKEGNCKRGSIAHTHVGVPFVFSTTTKRNGSLGKEDYSDRGGARAL